MKILKKVGNEFTVLEVKELTLDWMQEQVRGANQKEGQSLIERVKFSPSISGIVNEEGVIFNLPVTRFNNYPFAGAILFVRNAGDDFTGLTDDDIEFLKGVKS